MPRGGPPSGEGADLAMFDGAELGKAIAAHPGEIEAAASATAHHSNLLTSSPA
jgi:hypothetical protein